MTPTGCATASRRIYASGDDRSDPGTARGFDTITDNPNLAGGQFMFWTQQKSAVALGGSPQIISEKFSLLPNLRSKFGDRANFVNPGLMLVNGGLDMRLSPALKLVTNVSTAAVRRRDDPAVAGRRQPGL